MLKKLVICVLVICLSILPLSAAFSVTSRAEEQDLSQAEADAEASLFISEAVRTGKSPWNSSTKWTEVIPMYDYDGAINAYLYILETDGVRKGYVHVGNLRGYVQNLGFSYGGNLSYARTSDGSADIDKIDWEAWEAEGKTIDGKLYYFGPSVGKAFYVKKDTDTFVELQTGGKYTYDDIKEMYDKYYRSSPSSGAGVRTSGPFFIPYYEIIIFGCIIVLVVLIVVMRIRRSKKMCAANDQV